MAIEVIVDSVTGEETQVTIPDPPAPDFDQMATDFANQFLEEDIKMKALAGVLADLAVASGVAPDVATARQEVRDRFQQYYRALIG